MSIDDTLVQPLRAKADQSGRFADGSGASLKGRWSVLCFYPADFTFVCPTELEDLAEHLDEFRALGVDVYGISTDTHYAHKAWHDASPAIGKVRCPLIGDSTGRAPGDVLCGDPARPRVHLARAGAAAGRRVSASHRCRARRADPRAGPGPGPRVRARDLDVPELP